MGDQGRTDTATVLFTDLTGSTELRSRLGEEAADELRRRHDDLVVAAIEGHRGEVVKHLGDGIMATFTGAADALSGAVAVQQAIEGHNRGADAERMSVRIGLSTGDVSFEGDDCFGLPVVEAQRLEAAAEAGQILCSQLVQLMSRGRGGHAFRPVGELQLKGIDQPVPALEVDWEPPTSLDEPLDRELPRALTTRGSFDFAGRASELAFLVDAYKQAASGRPTVVLISGEPGIGKTRLVSELAQRALDGGALVLAGRSDEQVRVAYRPFVEALRTHLEHASGSAADVLGPRAGELRRLLPDLDALLDDVPAAVDVDDPEFERFQVLGALVDWLRIAADDDPVVLVLDDLHWAEAPTLAALRHVIDEMADAPLLVVGTYRDTDLDRTHPLSAALADFRRRDDVRRLDLAGLTAADVEDFLTVAAGHELDDAGAALAHAVHRETSGNPFFVGEVLRHLAESGAIVQRDGRWTSELELADLGIPEGIREVVGRRLDRLPDDAGRVLATAAVIGHEFEVELLAAALGAEIDAVLDALDEAAGASLVLDEGVDRYRFTHALVRTTLVEELSTTRRSRLHRKIATELERRHDDQLDRVAPRLAHHWAETADPDPTTAVRWAIVAAEAALEQTAPDDARRWCESGLELLDPDQPDRAQQAHLLVTLAASQLQLPDPAWRDSSLEGAELALGVGEVELATRALTMSSESAFTRGHPVDHPRVELIERALDVTEDIDPIVRLHLMLARAEQHLFAGEDDARTAIAEEAADLLRSTPMEASERLVLGGRLFQFAPFTRQDLRSVVDQVADDLLDDPAHQGNDAMRAMAAWSSWASAAGRADRPAYDRARRVIGELDLDRLPRPTVRMFAMHRVMDGQLHGQLRDVEEAIETFVALSDADTSGAGAYRGLVGYVLARERGQLADISSLFSAMATENSPGPTSAVIASGLAGGGDLEGARRVIDDRRPFTDVADDPGYPVEVCCFVDAVALTDHADAAKELEPLVERLPSMQVQTGGFMQGATAWWRARLAATIGHRGRAEALFRDAIDVHDAFGARAHQARSRVDFADLLVDLERTDEARALAREALELVEATELAHTRSRAEALLGS